MARDRVIDFLPSDIGLEVFDGVTSSPPPHTSLFGLHHRVHHRLHPLIVQTPSLHEQPPWGHYMYMYVVRCIQMGKHYNSQAESLLEYEQGMNAIIKMCL